MKPALSQVCSLDSPFEADLADYAAGGCRAVEIWLGKLEGCLGRHDVAGVRRLAAEHQLEFAAASYQGGLFDVAGEARETHWSHFQRRLALCRELEIPTLVVAANTAIPRRKSDWEAMMALLARAAAMAGEAQVRLALEFQAASPMCNNLQTAASAVEECGSTWLGLCLDSFHFYVGPSKTEDLACLTSENLFHVQLSDLAGVPREMAADGDRILPGDGELPLAAIVEACRRLNYGGYVSIELMNPQIWRVPALQFGEVAMKSLSAILAATS